MHLSVMHLSVMHLSKPLTICRQGQCKFAKVETLCLHSVGINNPAVGIHRPGYLPQTAAFGQYLCGPSAACSHNDDL